MDSEDFRSILESVDVWAFMDAAIAVASVNYADELKRRRDRIVELVTPGNSDFANSDAHQMAGIADPDGGAEISLLLAVLPEQRCATL
ncbi:hypothetical protein JHK84_043500 [Glycine max]|nr:hypothetical protein JHK86_043315 [Glycine max]KAG5117387.1 hypothetical protein JHK84_043500 [Glycine max]